MFGDRNLEEEEILRRFEEIRQSAVRPGPQFGEEESLPEEEPVSTEEVSEPTAVAPNQMQDYLSELKRLQDTEQSNLRNIGLFQAADKISRSMAAGYGGKVEAADTDILKEMATKPVKNYMDLLAKYKEKTGASKGFQQTDYMTETGEPLTFNPVENKFTNVLTGKPHTGQVIRNYVKTITDEEGRIREVRPGQGVVGTLSGAPSQTPTEQTQEKDYTYEMLTPKQREYFADVEKEYATDIKDSREFGEILANVEDLVEADISAAIGAIQRQLARSVGREVGVMTDADVAAFSGDRSLIGAMQRFAKLKAMGTMTEKDKDQYRQIIGIARRNLAKSMENRAGFHAAKLKQRLPDASQQSLFKLLSVDAAKPVGIQTQTPEGKIKVQMEDGRAGFIDKDKVDAFKQKHPKARVMQ
jgi:hypothetical protein